MDEEYLNTTYTGNTPKAHQAAFEKQKQFLQASQPFDPQTYNQQFFFGFKDYSRAQALELLPLLATYKTKLSGDLAEIGALEVDQLVSSLNQIINPPSPVPQSDIPPPPPPALTIPKTPPSARSAPNEIITNALAVNKFLEIPLDGLPGDHISAVTITAHHWLGGKLLLDFEYGAFLYTFDEKGNWRSTRNATLPGIAILDPATEHWEVVSCPDGSFSPFYHHSTLLHDELFTSGGGQIRKYDFNQRQWQSLPISGGNDYELFAVNGRLYAATGQIIFEITDGGKSSHILASTRRQPPVTALDIQNLGLPTVLAGPNHSLRVSTAEKLFTWTGNDWHEDSAAPASEFTVTVSAEGALFRDVNRLFRLMTDAVTPESCLRAETPPDDDPPSRIYALHDLTTPYFGRSLWELPSEICLANLAATMGRSNLYLLAGHSELQPVVNDQHVVVKQKVVGKDGFNAFLLCFSPRLPQPQKVFLNFDSPNGRPPLGGVNPGARSMFPSQPLAMVVLAGDNLLFAPETSGLDHPMATDHPEADYKTGVWLLPVSRLEPIIAVQKQAQMAQMARWTTAAKRLPNELLATYDLNHNGTIDSDEREEALDDPAFIELELNTIDANHNGWLDVPELAWFDANQNKMLDLKKQAGITTALHLFAKRLFNQFDTQGNGGLNRMEYEHLIQSSLQINANAEFDLQFVHADENHDAQVDAVELEDLMKRHLEMILESLSHGPSGFRIMQRATDDSQILHEDVDSYWRYSGDPLGKSFFRGDLGFAPEPVTPLVKPLPISPQARGEMEQFQKSFLEKYDHNHNGVLDADERSEAKDDADYSRYMINGLRLQPQPAARPPESAHSP